MLPLRLQYDGGAVELWPLVPLASPGTRRVKGTPKLRLKPAPFSPVVQSRDRRLTSIALGRSICAAGEIRTAKRPLLRLGGVTAELTDCFS
jgi:hypothetical protein